MKLAFTKMQGAGNDFVVIDATRQAIKLSADQVRRLGDRRFGVGADQILLVETAPGPGVDFRYRIFNNSGEEVEHCGNGARCFLRYVRAKGLTDQRQVRVQTLNRVLELREDDDGRVSVDMGPPVFDLARVPFDASGLDPQGRPVTPPAPPAGDLAAGWPCWPLLLDDGRTVEVAVLSMGNPHAVQRVGDVDTAPVAEVGPQVERHPRFLQRVNAGFMQVVDRRHIRLRVFERGAGETLACGTGACAAVVAGIRRGWLDPVVDVQTRGGRLTVEWEGLQRADAPVFMSGPAEFVFEGEIAL
jgi:diaminopimelate epimerase